MLELEVRNAPSIDIPLTPTQNFVEIGPRPIASQIAGQNTSAPGNLATTGRIVGIAAHPDNPDVEWIAAAGGGVARTDDGGVTWTEQTDRLPGLTDEQRNLAMGSIAISPVWNGTFDTTAAKNKNYDIFAGEGELNNSGDSYTGKGILKSSDGGATWKLIEGPGQAFVDGAVPRIVIVKDPANPSNEIVYAVISGSRIGGLGVDGVTAFPAPATVYGQAKPNAVYRSNDGGVTWTNITANLNSQNLVSTAAQITDFAVDPTNPNFAYVAIGDSGNFSPGRSYGRNGVYRTSDSLDGDPTGKSAAPTWSIAFGGTGAAFVPGAVLGRTQVVVAPSRPSDVYAVVEAPTTGKLLAVFRSTDIGINWDTVTNSPNFLPSQGDYNLGLAVDPRNENYIYLVGTGGTGFGFDNEVVMATDAGSAKASAGAVNLTWSNLTAAYPGPVPHADAHAVALDASFRLMVATDGGTFRTTISQSGTGTSGAPTFTADGWVSMNGDAGSNALNVAEMVGIAMSPRSAEEAWAGLQDNGLVHFVDPGNGTTSVPNPYGWSMSDGGDAGFVVVNNLDPNNIFHTAPYGSARVSKSTDGGKTWTVSQAGIGDAGKGLFYPPLIIDPSQTVPTAAHLLLGEDEVYESKDSGGSWSQVGNNLPYVGGINPPGQHAVTAIGIGRSDPNVIYAAVADRWLQVGGAWVDFGPALYQFNRNLTPIGSPYPTWVDVSPGATDSRLSPITGAPTTPVFNDLPGPITDIAVDPDDSGIVYITVDVAGQGEIWTSVNGVWVPGDQPPTWTDITGNLPDRHAYSVAIDPNLLRNTVNAHIDDDIYVGTGIGTYVWHNPTSGTPNWVRVGGDSLPDVLVTDVQVNTTTGILAVGTYGRGLWEYQIRPFISGYQFEDLNGDGVREANEPGLDHFSVVVTNLNTNNEQANTYSNGALNGYWEFRSLPDDPTVQDKYRITEDLNDPAATHTDWVQTSPNLPNYVEDKAQGLHSFTFANYTNQNIGNFHKTSISGIKFEDLNGNGIQEPNEPGLGGWTIQLLINEGTPQEQVIASTVTAADGSYSFNNLGPIQGGPDPTDPTGVKQIVIPYEVREVMQTNWVQTFAASGQITLTSGTPSTGNNFGNFRLFSITGVKYEDLNGDGQREPGEPGLQNWTFSLLNANGQPIIDSNTNQPVKAVTDANGNYAFNNLTPFYKGAPVIYRVREVGQTGWAQTSPMPADVAPVSGQALSGGDFGNFREVTVSGLVFDDTNGDGVREAGENTPVPGATVTLTAPGTTYSQTTTVLGDGSFSFPNQVPQFTAAGQVAPFVVTLTPPSGYIQTTLLPSGFTISSGQSVTNLTFGVFKSTSINGYVYLDANGDGAQDNGETAGLGVGTTLDLIAADSGAVISSTPIGPDGLFNITALGPIIRTPGASVPYLVRVHAPSGWVMTAPTLGATTTSTSITLQSGVPIGPLTFGAFQLTSISGTVFNDLNGDGFNQSGESGGVPGATVTLIDTRNGQPVSGVAPVTTGSDGKYAFSNLGPLLSNNVNAPYKVVVAPPAGWISTSPTSTEVNLRSGAAVPGQNFEAFKQFTISGKAFNDLNANRVNDKGEPGLAGWQMTLTNLTTGATATATTDASGNYSFPTLGPGVYRVRETVKPSWLQLSPNPADITGVSGTDVPNQVFADFRTITISGFVIEDLNRNGVLDAGEPGSPGWVVDLFDATGAEVSATTTDPTGAYAFPTLGPGTYTVKLTPRTSWVQTTTDPAAVAAVSGQDATGRSFGVLRLGSISGTFFSDSNRNQRQDVKEGTVANVQVFLRDAQNNVINQTVTDATGNFAFNNVNPGSYSVTFLYGPAGSQFLFTNATNPFSQQVTVTSGSSSSTNAFNKLLGIAAAPILVEGPDAGGGPQVQVVDALTAQVKFSFFAYDPSFTGGVRVGQGDVNGDGVPDIVTAPGPGGQPVVKVFNGIDGTLLYSFMAYEPTFTGGMFISAGDVNSDGIADIITGTDIGGGPRVQVFDGKTQASIRNYFAYESSFRGGVRVAGGDVNGDGLTDIVTTPAQGGGPRVTAFDGQSLAVLSNFFAFDATDRSGVFVAAGDFNGDGVSDILVGQGASANPQVALYSTAGVQMAVAQAFPPDEFGTPFTGDVRVSVTDRFGDGKLDAVVATGPGSITRVRFLGADLQPTADELRPYPGNFTGGVYVG